MDPLQRVLEMDTSEGVLSKLPGKKSIILASFYADDVALFINPSRTDALIIRLILTCFGNITGLVTNRDKSSAMPIRCQGLDINHIFFFRTMQEACMYLYRRRRRLDEPKFTEQLS